MNEVEKQICIQLGKTINSKFDNNPYIQRLNKECVNYLKAIVNDSVREISNQNPVFNNTWEEIALTEDFIIEYDKTKGMYRVSYFQDNHFVDDVIFDQYADNQCPVGCPGTLSVYDL